MVLTRVDRSRLVGGRSVGSALAAIAESDPLLPLGQVRAMDQVVAVAIAEPRLLMTLVGTLARAALLLAAIGIHGLIIHVVSERTREFGIRLALGATAGQTMIGGGEIRRAAGGDRRGDRRRAFDPGVKLIESFLVHGAAGRSHARTSRSAHSAARCLPVERVARARILRVRSGTDAAGLESGLVDLFRHCLIARFDRHLLTRPAGDHHDCQGDNRHKNQAPFHIVVT